MQTMRRPVLMPCGHIGDRETTLRLGYCRHAPMLVAGILTNRSSLDRTMFLPDELVSLHPNISYLTRRPKVDGEEAKWVVQIVDYLRVRPVLPFRRVDHMLGALGG